MSTIHYNLQSTSAVLGVYCNLCNKFCNFCHPWSHYDVAFWTLNKDQILCSDYWENLRNIIRQINELYSAGVNNVIFITRII